MIHESGWPVPFTINHSYPMARGTNEMLRMRNHDVFAFVPKARLNHRSPWLDLAWSIRGFYHPSDFPEALGTPRCRVHVMSTLRGDANMYIGERHKACWLEEGVKRLGRECKKSETYPVWDNHITVMVVHDELKGLVCWKFHTSLCRRAVTLRW